ncbi:MULTISPECIES: CgeB family protein [unclassified Rhizobium]|uniref:CgeB family protein n=1 Tax=unclassified Rhizobium TaxID=2613769 RepID=UPI0007EAC878|nr:MULTISPECIES: glycosyltransferase [unclassified Rhizobium]ANM13206.1 glycosyltransferase domain-containing protein [Rhizobium sp. N324]ANM19604.1 glycosyltransferase domain-containing protein [Rhizobium sp. N541]ANM25989.1 glycosyltransferase domain-containing protein [Rhizobium sp. N941]OYD00999.1 glycosyltransferase domain-containing protein [Rhizobium sp. N4311]
MKFVFYTHSLISDWNHGNAHFLRGVMRDLQRRGHETLALEPEDSWSRANLVSDQGSAVIAKFHETFPQHRAQIYGKDFDHEAALGDAYVVIVHEWTQPDLVERLGRIRRHGGTFTLLFHDTHHRAVSAEGDIAGLTLSDYDGVLAFGETLRERYLRAGWGRSVFTWHEAADDALFRPMPEVLRTGDLIWIGNWGDGERSAEIAEFLVHPAKSLALNATVRGVRYPDHALDALQSAGIAYGGWIANADVPVAFARHKVTVHIPRRPYIEHLPGIPTIRVFEALSCGIPLISAPWDDAENLFKPGTDFLLVRDGEDMRKNLRDVLADPGWAASLAASGLVAIKARHTCRHRVDELFEVLACCGTNRVTTNLQSPEAAE